MSKLDEVYKTLLNLYKKNKRGISAAELSDYMHLDRANISRYLNKLYKDGRVDKTDGRPVIYSISTTIDEIQEKEAKQSINSYTKDSFAKMIGSSLTLQVPIQQAKAAILYPPHGLHTLILGETGVGKSMFAELMYEFSKEYNIISKDASFVRFNCADYADNPQLVTAQIFGVKKGAYTGADSDKEGLLKKADGGILFLDEIHRLPPQAQEMLFTYIDKGSFRPLGETEKIVHVDAQIIAATTEDPKSFMLRTFTRRIPMTITLPSLRERTLEERYYLLEQFIKLESRRLMQSIYVSKNALISFLLYDCPNNIGQFKSDIQLACAKAFLNYKANGKEFILIEQTDLHPRVKYGIMKLQDYREQIDVILSHVRDMHKFSYKDDYETLEMDSDESIKDKYFYDTIEKRLKELKDKGLEEKEINDILNVDIAKYFKKYIRGLPRDYRKEEISKIVDISIVNTVEKILDFASKKLNRSYDEKVYFGLALHLQGSLERIKAGSRTYHPKLNLVRCQYNDEFFVAMEAAKIIDNNFGIQVPLDEIGYLTMFIAIKPYEINKRKNSRVGIIVLMHGTSTASSMVQVANTLIGKECAYALDMPLNMRAEKMYSIARDKVVEIDSGRGVLMLVDMGSLTNFGDMIKEETGIKVKTIDMASTLLVLDAGRKSLNGNDLDEIYNSCLRVGRNSTYEVKVDSQIRKNVIITACFTGEGSAARIKSILNTRLKNAGNVKIIPLNIIDKADFLDNIDKLKKEYNIIALVSTVFIEIDDIPFIPAPDILAGKGIEKMDDLINKEEDYIRICKSMDNQIKDIDGIELVQLIRESIKDIEERLELKLLHEVKIGMVIHLCFLIDRSINGDKSKHFDKLNEYRDIHSKEFIMVKQSVRKLEIKYNITIDDNQLAFIVRMVIENSISV